MNTDENVILTETGEVTELSTPDDFGNGLAFLNPSEFPDLDSVEVGISIKPDYIEFNNAGENVRGVFNGISEITTKDQQNPGAYKRIPAIVLQTKDGLKLNAGANLVSQLQTILPGTAIQITYKGLEATKSGNKVKAYEVRLLNVPRMNVSPVAVSRPALPASTPEKQEEEPEALTYEVASRIKIKTANGEKEMGELTKEQLDYVVQHAIIRRNAEAAQIVLEHDFGMTPVGEEPPFSGEFPF